MINYHLSMLRSPRSNVRKSPSRFKLQELKQIRILKDISLIITLTHTRSTKQNLKIQHDIYQTKTYLKLWIILPQKKLNKARNNTRSYNFFNWWAAFWCMREGEKKVQYYKNNNNQTISIQNYALKEPISHRQTAIFETEWYTHTAHHCHQTKHRLPSRVDFPTVKTL